MDRRGPIPRKRITGGKDQHRFVYEEALNEKPYLCSYYHPISVDRLRTIPKKKLSTFVLKVSECFLGRCNNTSCLKKAHLIHEKHLEKTMSRLIDLDCERDIDPITYRRISGLPFIKEKKKVVEHYVPPEVIKKTVYRHVYLSDSEPSTQNTKTIRRLEPERTKKVVNKHVYLPEPVVKNKYKVHHHSSSSGRQTYSASHGSYHEHGESSKSAEHRAGKHAKTKTEGSDSDDIRKYSSTWKRKGRQRDDDCSEEGRKNSQKGKGKQKDDRDDRRDASRCRNSDSKRSSSPSHRQDRDDCKVKREHSIKPRSPAHSRSRRRSPHKTALSTETHKQSSAKKIEKSRVRELEPKTPDQEDDDAYCGSDTNNSEPKVPPLSTSEVEAPPKSPPVSSFDPYSTLGLQNKCASADQVDISAAYKFLVRKWHPDRHMNKSKEEQEKATTRTAELNRAYDILGNEGRKKVFDRTGKTELWELDKLVEQEAENEKAIARPG